MTINKLRKLYKTKKGILDEAEVRVRKALIHTQREAGLESALFVHVRELQKAHCDIVANIELLARQSKKRGSHNYITKELAGALHEVAKLHHEVGDVIKDLRIQKKAGVLNAKTLMRDFKKLRGIRERMDKHLD